jgi:hypothetical protein
MNISQELSESGKFDEIIESGMHHFDELVEPDLLSGIYANVARQRACGPDMFLSEAEFDACPQYVGVNPVPGRNFVEQYSDELAVIESHPALTSYLSALLGPQYEILNKKMICGVPESVIPHWLKNRIEGNFVNNLGSYIRPELRDMTYFWGIDLHQDIIDWKSRFADFITLYIYIHDVGAKNSPLYVLPGSHKLGATVFPHSIEKSGGDVNRLEYSDGRGHSIATEYHKLLGPVGTANLWHPFTLHGTQPNKDDQPRFSLRYLISREPAAESCGLDLVNSSIKGPMSLENTRDDLAKDGAAGKKGNIINKIE